MQILYINKEKKEPNQGIKERGSEEEKKEKGERKEERMEKEEEREGRRKGWRERVREGYTWREKEQREDRNHGTLDETVTRNRRSCFPCFIHVNE